MSINVQCNPPNLGDYSSDEGSDDEDQEYRPLTHQELKIKTMKTIHKKASSNTKDANTTSNSKAYNKYSKRTVIEGYDDHD